MCEFVSETQLNISLLHFKAKCFKAPLVLRTPTDALCRVCGVATTNKRVKILDFKLFYKHFIFVEKANFDVKKVLKRHIDVYVFVDVVCVSEK